ncbi:hypothetical protein SAMN06265182_1240 [Persephonella hydrogeniphila]|uniref:Uncharacterized protein n=1 Tax=Persephonella hydrogeniphila TaxID=198703 RepID=A0A285NFI1_9AQUI|nr:hypothetical protein [Persephonella hydrogeniphila]SNZ08262.1 hypothetical protein SAMN06265182_1240 [Persephonella hydrogeniphila]
MGDRRKKEKLKEVLKEEKWIVRMYYRGNIPIEVISEITDYPKEKIEKIISKSGKAYSERIIKLYRKLPEEIKELIDLLRNCHIKKIEGNKEVYIRLPISQIYQIVEPHLEKHNIKISLRDFYELYTFMTIREV